MRFFHLSGNAINVSIIYILAILLHAQYTKCYSAGIIASIYSVFWVNYAYTYPYMTLNFTLSGYPLTFVGMTFISCFTSSICIMLSKQSAQIQEKDRMLMQAEKETMRANLLRAMSHDLRTPLTTIIGSSATYLEQENEMPPEEKRKLIHNIEEDAQWLLNMVENLLSVTRIRVEDTHVNTSPEPLEEVVAEAVQRFRKRLPQGKVDVRVPDEFLMVPMDATLIEQVIINLLEKIQDEQKLSYIVIAHDLTAVRHISHNIGVMYLGHMVEIGPADQVYGNPLHPYTKALIASIPVASPNAAGMMNRVILKGEVPSPIDVPSGCPFSTRCQYCTAKCKEHVPELRNVDGRKVACVLYE